MWLYEVASAINKSVYFGQITDADAQTLFSLMEKFRVELYLPTAALSLSAYHWTRKLNRASIYDSFYLALAENLNCQLWTLDQRLVNAVGRDWVKFVGPAS